jgi:hypothetical protein
MFLRTVEATPLPPGSGPMPPGHVPAPAVELDRVGAPAASGG